MKQQFRNKDGCCICATKSSTTRFQPSKTHESHFPAVFGARTRYRSGFICNACVLCVKRGTGAKQPGCPAPYAGVVDSRRGTGPKHMKQIGKRNRRREQREAATRANTANKQLLTPATGSAGGGSSGQAQQQLSGTGVDAENVGTAASAAAAAASVSAADGAGCGVGGDAGGGSDKLPPGMAASGSSAESGGSGAAVAGGGLSGAASSAAPGSAEFRAPLAPPASERQHYYKKRVIMKPVKTPDTRQEISELFEAVIRSRNLSEGPLSVQQVHSAFINTKRRRMMAASNSSETASVGSTEPPESFTSGP